MEQKNHYLGIDIGSVAMSVVAMDDTRTIIHSSYLFHNGFIHEQLQKTLGEIDLRRVCSIGITSSTPPVITHGIHVDSKMAFIAAARHFHPGLNALLIIGAEKFGLVTFNNQGEYLKYKSNSACAAGTGNFLDQQAERLNLKSIREFSDLAFHNTGNIPKIASRCAVFAKTDLIHAQQEGYSLAEICDGLSYGAAKNIADVVLRENTSMSAIIAAGGVALNKAVIRHLEKLSGKTIIVDDHAQVYSAVGAALYSIDNRPEEETDIHHPGELLNPAKKEKVYFYPPLKLELSDYPDFTSLAHYEFQSTLFPLLKSVETDIYFLPAETREIEVFLGVDIGSTSTKAVLLSRNKEVIAGLYTRTSGQPLKAVQLIFEAIQHIEHTHHVQFKIAGAGTTGSGRKFTGKIIGADSMPDEITAHARAAFELDPEVDTIIEIGGQDSKFTLIRDGMVTFSVMNNVCAAGTGSFIEEQAIKLGCPLDELSQRAENASAPMANDRCTVFMERDLNYYLNTGYSVEEILAAVLHSTRENYLTKVALKGSIGKKIFFQGATAKNKALVAAFEQKLKKPIMVSRYCHLTGALGTALELFDQNIEKTRFRGLDLYKKEIPVRSEVCDLCTNHCKLKVAEINGETEAYGFLCGRDYSTRKYVKHESVDFNIMAKRKEIFRFKPSTGKYPFTIGIPAGLHLYEEIPFWRKFFELLSINTITSEDYEEAVKSGKNLSSAEFCAPISAMYGHVEYLKDKADYIFLPVYLGEPGEVKYNNQYCYYTQFASSFIALQKQNQPDVKILMPVLKSIHGEIYAQVELFSMLKFAGMKDLEFSELTGAYESAKAYTHSLQKKWKSLYPQNQNNDDIHIMLLGRPYTVLSPVMNKHIPDLIEKNGVKTFCMNMMSDDEPLSAKTEELVKSIKWKFASKILHAAEKVAQTPDCYPVLITSFKCTPDSFVIEYFKEIFNSVNKPYLILQLDEHDSAVGNETRIEAGIRAFRNHRLRETKTAEPSLTKADTNGFTSLEKPNTHEQSYGVSPDEADKVIQPLKIKFYRDRKNMLNDSSSPDPPLTTETIQKKTSWEDHIRSLVDEAYSVLKDHAIDFSHFRKLLQKSEIQNEDMGHTLIRGAGNLKDKTLLLPSWDPLTGPLLEAVLRNCGIDARALTDTDESIRRSMSYNTGQCLPLNIIVQDAVDYIEKNRLNPKNTAIWMIDSVLSCNLCMFPHYSKKLLTDYGKGLENTSVYLGELIFNDISLQTAINAYLAYMFGGYIRKISCKIRPYEIIKGSVDAVTQMASKKLYETFRNGYPKEKVLKEIIKAFKEIETKKHHLPKVAIFGDLYVRDNEVMNQGLIKTIEENGGEVITTPYNEYIKIIVNPLTERSLIEGRYMDYAKMRFLKSLIPLVEEKYNKHLWSILDQPNSVNTKDFEDWLTRFNLSILHRGEAFENILKIHNLIKNYPDIALFIQTNPSYCCPSLVTEAMAARIEELTGVPVLTIEYDGTSSLRNDAVIPYLKLSGEKTNIR